jgi:hypothetical protein
MSKTKRTHLVRFNAYIWNDQKELLEKLNKKFHDNSMGMNESKLLREIIDMGRNANKKSA